MNAAGRPLTGSGGGPPCARAIWGRASDRNESAAIAKYFGIIPPATEGMVSSAGGASAKRRCYTLRRTEFLEQQRDDESSDILNHIDTLDDDNVDWLTRKPTG